MGFVTRRGVRTFQACPLAILLVITSVASHVNVAAQEVSASLGGRVTDASGRGLPGVAVSVESRDLISGLTRQSSTTGDYAFPSLPPGHYVVGFSREGLVPVKHTMRLSASERATLHVVLRPDEGFDGAITVMSERVAFPPSWATVLDQHDNLQQLPVTGTIRSALALATELPGRRPSESLFLLDGMPLRHGWSLASPVAFAGPGPEALRETSVIPGRLPADYGRLQAGAIAAVTFSGRQRLHGSFRAQFDSTDLNADLSRSGRPTDGRAGVAEYTIGGPLGQRRTWFFATGRHLAQSVSQGVVSTDQRFTTDARERFGLVKITHAPGDNHRLEAQWVGAKLRLSDAMPLGIARQADTRALENRTHADRAFSGAYVGQIGRRLTVTARYTREDGSVRASPIGIAGDLFSRTPIIDQETGAALWAPGSCAVCEPYRSRHHTVRVTAATLISSPVGSHEIGVGYDGARDAVEPASHPIGGSFVLRATRTDLAGGETRPVFAPGGSSWIVWRPDVDNQLTFRSHAWFVSDHWLPAPAVAIDLGVRVDAPRGTAGTDRRLVLSERTISPRLGATWRPSNRWPWTLTAAFGRYVDGAVSGGLRTSGAARPAERAFVYEGPAINSSGTAAPTGEAVARVFDWFFANGGTSRSAWFATEPGVSAAVSTRVRPPHVDEWSVGASRLLGGDGYARADVTWRAYANIPGRLVSPAGSSVTDRFGQPIDAGRVAADDRLQRRYVGLSLAGDYRFGHWADVGLRYTLSELHGNADGATGTDDPFASAALGYPEYIDPAWHIPAGALPDDARHRFRVWMHSELLANETRGVLVLTLMHSRESGRPYGAAGWVGIEPFVANPGYQQPPVAVRYFFTARDAFRTQPLDWTDLALAYRRPMPGTVHGEVFAQFDLLNLFDRVRVLDPARLVITRTAFTDPSLQPFNPFTETPVEGVHWTFDDSDAHRATAPPNVPRTLGRALRLTMGVRF